MTQASTDYILPEKEGNNQGAMIAAFLAQYVAERAKMPDVVPLDRYAFHVNNVNKFTAGLTDKQPSRLVSNSLGQLLDRQVQ